MDVPVQYYQSVIAIELAVTGALLFQIRFFSPPADAATYDARVAGALVRLGFAVILAATVFGSLLAILHQSGRGAAVTVTITLAVSVLPILVRALPPLARHPDDGRHPNAAVTIAGLIVFALITAAVVVLILV